MPSKVTAYAQMADHAAQQITGSRKSWTDFLTTAARLYKYPYNEQLMIYAQRPDATACAEYELWNEQMRRYVKRGSKGIALIDASGDKPRLRYVFDISDTGGRDNSRRPFLWELRQEHEAPVTAMLEREYEVSGADDLAGQLQGIAAQMADEYWLENSRDILYNIDDSYLEDYDEFNVGVAFREAATVSISYMLMKRCGIDPDEYFEHEDFLSVFDFSTPAAVAALGTATSQISQQVLRQIEVVIKNYERERSELNERIDVQPERGLSDSRPDDDGAEPADRQIREAAEELPERASPGAIQLPAAIGEAVSAPVGDRPDGEQPHGADDAGADEIGGRDREPESRRPDEVGGPDERPQSPGRGNDTGGAYLQLSLFPTEQEQVQRIAESEKPSAFSFPQADIDHILRTGSNESDSLLRICAMYRMDKGAEENAAFLRREYRGGKGLYLNGEKVSVWFGGDGIHIAKGETALYARSGQLIPWEQAERRIGELLAEGRYLPQAALATVDGFERTRLAQTLWYLHQDLTDEARQSFFDNEMFRGGFPDSTAHIAELLAQPESRAEITAELERFTDAYAQDRGLMRFHFHRPQELLSALRDLRLPRREYASELTDVPRLRMFVTQDEADVALTNGSSFEGGKSQIYAFFSQPHSPKEKADFLKKEYGDGGRSHALSGADGSWEDHSAKGIEYKRGPDDDKLRLSWSVVAKRIDFLIASDRYLTAEEKERFAQRQREQAGLPETRPTEPTPPAPRAEEAAPPAESEQPSAFFADEDDEIDREAERAIDAHEAEFGADGWRAFPGNAPNVEEAPAPKPLRDITQADIDAALQEWNGDIKSKQAVVRHMEKHARDKDTASFLRAEYGDDLPAFPVTADGAATDLPWPKVQRRIAQLIAADKFYTEDEYDNLDDVDPVAIRERLEQAGIANGEVIDPDALDSNPFIRQVTADAERSALQEEPPAARPSAGPPYSVGDTVYLENNRPFIIEHIGNYDVRLQDPSLAYPISRAESIENFERLLRRNPKNRAFTDFLTARLDGVQPDILEIIAGGLLSPAQKGIVSSTLEHGATNYDLAASLSETYPYDPLTMTLLDGTAADVFPQQGGLYIELQDKFGTKLSVTWAEVAPILRSLSAQGWSLEPEQSAAPVRETPAPQTPEQTPPPNFRITDDHLGEGGAKTKYGYNAAAIRTLQTIEAEGRYATPEEQEILSRYVGWGGIPQAFDSENASWAKEYTELKSLLTEDEYSMARASTLNAHYTSPVVIRAIYEAVERMGFTTGNVLEPACGVGNFFGLLPESMAESKLYGIELDSVTGRIAKQLYPHADITVSGFEKTALPDSFFDVAVGNVPFGSYKVSDRKYDKHNFLIHDYFFAKTLDQVRPGGIVALITTKGTLDKKSPEVRRYIAQRAELLGAVRLPNDAFYKNAGTEVTSDILILQKRDRPIDIEPDWVHLAQTEDGVPVNSYFADHPEMMLGTMAYDDRMYGNKAETTCVPIEGADLAAQLREALSRIGGRITEAELPDLGEGEEIDTSIPADPSVKNFTYTLVDGEVYYRENSRMVRPELNQTAKERVAALIGLRDCVHTLMDYQLNDYSDAAIREKQAELNRLYDAFTAKYGLINNRGNSLAFSDDSSYYLLCSLEILDENGELERKADMFTRRTIKQRRVVTAVDTASEALALSISEKARVDMEYMAGLTGMSEEQLAADLQGVVFRLPEPVDPEGRPRYATADEYLSGNVREKLRTARRAAEVSDLYRPNVAALEAAQPKDLDASEIDVRLGATWVGPDYIQQFMTELFQTPRYLQGTIEVKFAAYTAEWNVTNKNAVPYNNVAAYVTYGTDRANAYRILEDTLNLRDVRIYDTVTDPDGKERRVLNKKDTMLAQQKQQAIKDAFRDWLWRDPDRRQTLVKLYNEKFNSTRPREYDGSHISFSGINPEITLRPHQQDAIAHILYGGNTLLAHEVGAGKTFEMVAAAMESKRLGLCQKSLFAVPNHLTEQWASEFLRLYPSANILVATKKDFERRNRKKFCARIATGDYDAVVIGHSQFERIPISAERQERLLQEQIWEITEGIAEVKESGGERFTIKQLERTKKSLEAKLEKLLAANRKDDVVTFEQLGIDRLYVDEAHSYKNLFLFTKMRNVAGLSTSDAQKSSDMFLKCRYIDELTEGKGVIFATGTPVSNSMTELYTMMRYLQYLTLQRQGLSHFDAWASTFGETVTAIELAPEGTGYRARTRFAKFFNLPELMTLFKEVADIKTADQLNLPTPKANYHTVVAQPTEHQKDMVAELSERAAAVHAGSVDPSEDNMLKITSDGRKLGLDQRIINPLLPDDPESKVNACVGNIYRIWDKGQDKRLTQLVFCDISTPKGRNAAPPPQGIAAKADEISINGVEIPLPEDAAPDTPVASNFSIYDDIRRKLTAKGVPAEQIAFIHEANTEVRKKELFAKVRGGQVRVLMGSTAKMGAGTNVQDRLVAMHDLDCPWRPGDLEQRGGRIVRQGNQNPEVDIYRYVTDGTFDAYLWQTVENKQKFISQIMTSKSPVRSCEDVDETALSYAEIKALCAGNPLIKEKMDLDIDVARLKLLKAEHQSQQYRMEDNLLRYFPENIERNKGYIKGFEEDMATLAAHPHPKDGFAGMVVREDRLIDKDNAGAALLEACKSIMKNESAEIGQYRGFSMHLSFDCFDKEYRLTLKGAMSHSAALGTDVRGNLIRIDNALADMPERLKSVQAQLENLYQQQEAAKQEIGKPFPQEAELAQKSARLAMLDAELNMDGGHPPARGQTRIAKLERPSVLEGLKVPCKSGPEKKTKTEREVR
jgi:N12 class adenine-specific DNA methylase